SAATDNFEISAWIPYWRSEEGVANILPLLGSFTEVNPFVYTVTSAGVLNEASGLAESEWVQLRQAAREQSIRFIPTVTWGGADAIDEILRDPQKRREHIRSIVQQVYAHDLDGIDIDYEGKYARTRPYFSLFLKELYEAMGNKWVMCTIEARTPLDSRYSTPEAIPADIEYANDFIEINKYCDRVRVMAYDQGRIDVKLNEQKGHPYIPVADTDWVEKAMVLAAKDIDKNKLTIGVPTYGYEYDMFKQVGGSGQAVAVDSAEIGEVQYSRLWSFNPGHADEIAQKLGITPTRNSAGELFLTYPASQSPDPTIPLPFATRVMSWSDAEAVRAKIDLAERLGLRGVSVFKIDGGQDQQVLPTLTARSQNTKEVGKSFPGSIPPLSGDSGDTPLSGGGNPSFSLAMPARNLFYGVVGEDVRTLQKFLNAKGFTVAQTGAGSPGSETAYFGSATRAALARFQASHNVSPSVGYYGPITRAAVAAAFN
ncbi:MAG: glycosyl hydrolase family 18 protein, partial [bacterium]|nr:glycosyl hydrolase family 18 protein [bacterium]